jgi:cation/acetate symporter
MLINFAVTIIVSQFTAKPTALMQELVEEIRYPGRTTLVAKHAEGEFGEEALH